MKKKIIFILLSISVFGCIFAQENTPNIKTDDNYVFKMNQAGDVFLRLNINTGIPIKPEQLKFGMDLSFGAFYFITPHFGAGGNIAFAYNPTLGQKVFYSIPIMGEIFAQFEVGKFEIPLFLGVGGSFEHHSSNFYFGLVVKPEVGIFYRINPEWSVGATFAGTILPQWYTNTQYNYCGYLINPGLSARYHL